MRTLLPCSAAALTHLLAAGVAAAQPVDRLGPHLSLAGVVLERTTLTEAAGSLGRGEVRDNGGDSAAHVSYVCFVGPDQTTVVFSAGEIHGGRAGIYQLLRSPAGIDVSSEGYRPPPARCAHAPTLSRALHTAGGLGLGMSRKQVLAALGTPTQKTADTLTWSTGGVVELDGVLYTRSRVITARFEKGALVALSAWQETAS